eukprot:jgi/Astpho2/6461/Aster-06930
MNSLLSKSSRTLRPLLLKVVPAQRQSKLMSTQAKQGAQTQEAVKTREKYTLQSAAGKSRYEVGEGQRIATATAGVQAFVRFGSAAFVASNLANFRKRPQKPIELYEYEGLVQYDELMPALQLSGKSQFPYMVDPNTGTSMLESDSIINYLWQQDGYLWQQAAQKTNVDELCHEYGDGQVPLQLSLGPLTTITCGLGLLPRAGRGGTYRQSRLPKKPIDVWGYEASPFCKLAREVLVELELPHIYHTVARNSPRRKEMEDKWGVFQVPYIEDSNTGIAMFETPQINSYLEKTYAV